MFGTAYTSTSGDNYPLIPNLNKERGRADIAGNGHQTIIPVDLQPALNFKAGSSTHRYDSEEKKTRNAKIINHTADPITFGMVKKSVIQNLEDAEPKFKKMINIFSSLKKTDTEIRNETTNETTEDKIAFDQERRIKFYEAYICTLEAFLNTGEIMIVIRGHQICLLESKINDNKTKIEKTAHESLACYSEQYVKEINQYREEIDQIKKERDSYKEKIAEYKNKIEHCKAMIAQSQLPSD